METTLKALEKKKRVKKLNKTEGARTEVELETIEAVNGKRKSLQRMRQRTRTTTGCQDIPESDASAPTTTTTTACKWRFYAAITFLFLLVLYSFYGFLFHMQWNFMIIVGATKKFAAKTLTGVCVRGSGGPRNVTSYQLMGYGEMSWMSCSDAFHILFIYVLTPPTWAGRVRPGWGVPLHRTLVSRWKWRHRHGLWGAWNLCKCTEFVWKLFYSIQSSSHPVAVSHALIKHARVIVLCLSKKLLIPHVVRWLRWLHWPRRLRYPSSSGSHRLLARQSPAVCFMQISPLCATMLLKNDNKPSAQHIEKKRTTADLVGNARLFCILDYRD